jgi:hypothetical protein
VNKEGYGDYFCSYGISPAKVFSEYLNRVCVDWNFNVKRVQGEIATTCGQYCVFFLFCRAKGLSLAKFMSLFSSKFSENDEIVTAFVNGKFNVATKIFDRSLFQ